jgi:hypothetical protein
MINNDLYFTFIKISSNYTNLMVCKYWYKNIIKDIKKKKLEFYDTQLYYAINNKHMYLSYSKFDKILLSAYDNIILNIIKNVINDEDIKDNFMNKMIENYKQLSIIIAIFYNYNTNTSTNITNRNDDDKYDNIEKYIAEDYSKLLSKFYNYNIILA